MTPDFHTPGKRRRRAKGEGGIYRRADGQWVGAVELPKGPDGRRRRVFRYGPTKNTVVVKLQQLRREIDAGTYTGAPSPSVEQWLTYWLDNIARDRLRPRTYATYRAAVHRQIIPYIGARRLEDLTTEDVRTMHARILETRSSRTCEVAHNILSKALQDAMLEHPPKVGRNVAAMVHKPRVVGAQRPALTAPQARTLLQSSYAAGDPMFARWVMALLTGARQGECLGLQWSRVHFDSGVIDLSLQLQQVALDVPDSPDIVRLHSRFALVPPKTVTSRRLVPMTRAVAEALAAHRETAPFNPWGLVWTTPAGLPIGSGRDTAAWYAALERAGLPRVPLHSARHSTATLLRDLGVEESVRMQVMGHSTTAAARIYTEANLTSARAALEKLDGIAPKPQCE